MNRRGFLTKLFTGTVAAIAAPQIITHGLGLKIATTEEVLKYAVVPLENIAVPNPDYVNAPFEVKFLWDPSAFKVGSGIVYATGCAPKDGIFLDEAYPIRAKSIDDLKAGKIITPWILQRRNA